MIFSNVRINMTITESDKDQYVSISKELKKRKHPDNTIISNRPDKQRKSFQMWDQDNIDVTITITTIQPYLARVTAFHLFLCQNLRDFVVVKDGRITVS